MKFLKKMISLACAAAVTVSVCGTASAVSYKPLVSTNRGGTYSWAWSSPIDSYLYQDGDDLVRVEHNGDTITVETYNDRFLLQSAETIPMELSKWGGFYFGSDYNFLIFGQDNPDEDDSLEVIRVVKYSKDWERLDEASLSGINTVEPFGAGSLRCAEYGDMLYIRTSHEMYASADGLNHQSNLTFSVDINDMEITDCFSRVANIGAGYVSHSFNQFILIDDEANIITLDHGDAYPRSIVLGKYTKKAGDEYFINNSWSGFNFVDIVEFDGEIGDNATGATIGGLTETSDGYLAAYSDDGTGGNGSSKPDNIYLAYVDKDNFSERGLSIRKVTDYSTGKIGGTEPRLVPTSEDEGYIIWANTGTENNQISYASYSADGTVSNITVVDDVMMSDCQPIVYNGAVVWYATNNSTPVFYQLQDDEITQTPVANFEDVDDDAYYCDAVFWALSNEITSGASAASFAPDKSCTRAQIMTMLWRAMGSPKPAAARNPFTDVSSSDYFYQAALWAVQNGITSGTSADQFSPNQNCTRGQAMTFIWNAKDKPSVSNTISFRDVTSSDYYYNPVRWAVRNNITSGTSATAFSPNQICTRAQIVTFIYKAMEHA